MWRIANDEKCIQVQIWTFTTSEKSSEMDLHWYDIKTTEERVCATCFHLFFVDLRSSWTCVIRERRIRPCKPWVKLIVKSNHTAVRFWPQLQKNAFINIQAQHEIFSLLQCSLCRNWQKHEQQPINDWETSYCIVANGALRQTRKLSWPCIIHSWTILQLSDWRPKHKRILDQRERSTAGERERSKRSHVNTRATKDYQRASCIIKRTTFWESDCI